MSLNLTTPATEGTASATGVPDRPMFEIDDRYRRVGGWLLLFCINLLLTPAVAVLSIVWLFALPEEYGAIPGLMTLLRIGVVQGCILGALCLVAAVKLIRIRPDAIRFTRLVLILHPVSALSMLLMTMLVGVPDEMRSAAYWEQTKDVLQYGVFAGVWFAYFAMSERVARTYLELRTENLELRTEN